MKEGQPQSPIPHEYSQDEQGLYNTHVFEQTGEKFRPIDFQDQKVVTLTPEIIFDRIEHQHMIESQQSTHISQSYGLTGERNDKREVQKTVTHRKVFRESEVNIL